MSEYHLTESEIDALCKFAEEVAVERVTRLINDTEDRLKLARKVRALMIDLINDNGQLFNE